LRGTEAPLLGRGAMDELGAILERLDRIEKLLVEQKTVRERYTTEEFAELAESTCLWPTR
jgi:hypothetical protein